MRRREKARMTHHDDAAGIDDDRLAPDKFLDARGDLVDCRLRNLPRVLRVRNRAIEGPEFNFHHETVSSSSSTPSRKSAKRSLCAGLSDLTLLREAGERPNSILI